MAASLPGLVPDLRKEAGVNTRDLAQKTRPSRRQFGAYDWVVDTVELELSTHHAVIEPRLRNCQERNFGKQRQARKT